MNSFASPFRRRLMISYKTPLPNYLCFKALEDGTFTFTYGQDVAGDSTSVSYSLDGKNWATLTNVSGTEVSITTPTISAGSKVYWKGVNKRMAVGEAANKYSWFSSTGNFDVSGDLQSILYDENFEGKTNTQWGTSYCFCSLFINCTKLVNTKDLLCNAKYGSINFYKRMFMGCSSLVSNPTFEETFNQGVGTKFTEYVFQEIYRDCISLVHPNWQFPVVNPGKGVYNGMFRNTSVTEARFPPSTVPLTNNIFELMYEGCKKLVTVPSELSWTSLTSYCYSSLFANCTSLTYAPKIIATVPASYSFSNMFSGCTSLINVPDITLERVGTQSCYYMFRGCTSLTKSPIKNFPASTASQCYQSMFEGCNSLEDEFVLPSETTANYCYLQMFKNTKVNYIKALFTNIANGALNSWVQGVPSNGIFVKNINATWTATGVNGVPTNWTVIYYDPSEDKYYTDQTKATECDDHGNPI